MDTSLVASISAGSVEYSLDDAAIEIQKMIDMLENAKDNGCTHVVGTSGNYRGAQWVRLGTSWNWTDE